MDGTVVLDPIGRPLTAARVLATKPLQSELMTRPGPGNKRLTYVSGEGVTRLLNEIFGFDGWCLDVRQIDRAFCSPAPDATGRFQVVYTAVVRLTVLQRPAGTDSASGTGNLQASAYREDIGVGDSYDKQLQTAIQHAVKGAVTDGVKRAARHFGDRLGNSLYEGNFSTKSAPVNLSHALAELDQKVSARYDWDLHARQLKKKQAPASAASSAMTANASASAPAGHASSALSAQQPRPPQSSSGVAQPHPSHHSQLQNAAANQRKSSVVGTSATLTSLDLAHPTACSAPTAQSAWTNPTATRVGPTTASVVGASGWQPPPTKPLATSSMVLANGNPPPMLVTPGPGGSVSATPLLLPPGRHPAHHRPRPETASGRSSLGSYTSNHGASNRGDAALPVSSGGPAPPPSASTLLPAKRPLEPTDDNASRWPPAGAHPAAPNKPPSPIMQPPQQQQVKKVNPYLHNLSN
jgi:DNA repair and recombination protein RAD52